MSQKDKFCLSFALGVAEMVCGELASSCERIVIAGSIRRGKPEVGDIEILYIPKTEPRLDLFGARIGSDYITDRRIAELEQVGVLERRTNVNGATTFGEHIKLLRANHSRVPVDLFATTKGAWFNYLVCRTGGAASNTRIAALAKTRGYKWKPYSAGFEDLATGAIVAMKSEEDVFAFVGLRYEMPEDRP